MTNLLQNLHKNVFIKIHKKGAKSANKQKTTNLVKNLKIPLQGFAAPPTYNTIRCT